MAKRSSRAPRQGLFRDRICAVIAAPTAAHMLRQLKAARGQTATIEIRFDWLESGKEGDKLCDSLGKNKIKAGLIATLRSRKAGGKFPIIKLADIHIQMMSLSSAVVSGCDWYDLEVETLSRISLPDVGLYLTVVPGMAGVVPKRITSLHDFEETPKELGKTLAYLGAFGGDALKIATQCNSIRDSLRVLALCKGRRDVIAVPMGEIGLPARVLALRHGSALAYAAVGEKTAPGQLTLDEMKNLYRADKLDRRSRVYGVIGDPIAHSLSPVLHNTGFIAKRMNDVYLPFLVRDLPDFLGAVKPLGIAGFSVTLPHKEKILRHLDDCDPLAARIGAVNTVVVRGGGKLYGMNTDYVGVLRAIERRMPLRGSRVLIYGAGGSARAVAFALAQAGAIVCVCARRMKQAEQLARAVSGEAVARARLRREFFDAIINATPVGMHPRESRSPLVTAELNCRLVFDLIYRPMQTKLLRLAASRGIETASGVEMFIAQGTAQFEIWTGVRAPEKEMRDAVMKKLKVGSRK